MPRINQAFPIALATFTVGAVINLLTNLVEPKLIRPWWWVLVTGLAVLVYISVYGIERRIESVSRIAACSPGGGHLYLFGITTAGGLASRHFQEGRAWSRWQKEKLPGTKACDVTAMAATTDLLEIYVADSEGVVWSRALGRDGRSWSGWQRLDTSGELGPVVAVAAHSAVPNWRELYAVGSNGKVAHRWRQDGHPWHEWHTAHHDDAQDVALTSAGRGLLECFVVSSDGELRHRWYRDGWSEWGSLGRPSSRSPVKAVAATSGQRTHQEVFVLDIQGDLAHRWYWPSAAWSDWFEFPVPDQVSDIAATATSPGRVHVIAVAESYGLWQRTYRESGWSSWERVR